MLYKYFIIITDIIIHFKLLFVKDNIFWPQPLWYYYSLQITFCQRQYFPASASMTMRHSGPVQTCTGPECLIDLSHVCVHPRQLYSSTDVKIFRLPKLKTKHNNLSLFKALVCGTNSLTTSDIFYFIHFQISSQISPL